MPIPFREPLAPRFIYVHPWTNKVHLMLPLVNGQEISTDNTCQAQKALKDFFDKTGAEAVLSQYIEALEFDIEILEEQDPVRSAKEERLKQINAYLEAVKSMQFSYGTAITAFLNRPSNLYSIQLRPTIQDTLSNVENPIFSIIRKNDRSGTPLSPLYNEMHRIYQAIELPPNPRQLLISKTLKLLKSNRNLTNIQTALKAQCLALFDLSIDFTTCTDSTLVSKAFIDKSMGFDKDASAEDYIAALLGYCAPKIFDSLSNSFFYTLPEPITLNEKAERLSILSQFFLAMLNIYCKSKAISRANFGEILDKSPELSRQLVIEIASALKSSKNVEEIICSFCNKQAMQFKLLRALDQRDMDNIRETFDRSFRTVTATKENPHMDDFLFLDREAKGESAKCRSHQGSIVLNFAEVVDIEVPNQEFYAQIRQEFNNYPLIDIPHKNEWLAGEAKIDPQCLAHLSNKQFASLAPDIQAICHAHPAFICRKFADLVAKGKQEDAQNLLQISSNPQVFLKTDTAFTDYSGRTFFCTAYEYAYWAKDIHMCRMLEQFMDKESKAFLLARIKTIESLDPKTNQKIGLRYKQKGTVHKTAHFDCNKYLSQLKETIAHWENAIALPPCIRALARAQAELPAHLIHELCAKGRRFNPSPSFNEPNLSRNLSYLRKGCHAEHMEEWFPLEDKNRKVIIKGNFDSPIGFEANFLKISTVSLNDFKYDLAAISCLDKKRSSDLLESQRHLMSEEEIEKNEKTSYCSLM